MDKDRFGDALLRALQCLSSPDMMRHFALLYDDLALWEHMADKLRLSPLCFDNTDVEVMRRYRSPAAMVVGYVLGASLAALVNWSLHVAQLESGRIRCWTFLALFYLGAMLLWYKV